MEVAAVKLVMNGPSWRPAWTSYFDDFAFQEDAPIDLAAKSLAWNPTQGGVDFSYQVTGADLPRDTTAALYWASGPTFADALQLATPALPIGTAQGSFGPIHVPDSELFATLPPLGTKYLLLDVDPNDVIIESNEANNVAAVSLCDKVIGNSVSREPTGYSLTGQFTTMKLTFIPKYGFDLQEAAELCGVNHFNWFNFFVAIPSQWTVNIFDSGSQIVGQVQTPIVDPVPGSTLRYAIDSRLAERREFISVDPPPDDAPFYYNESDGELERYTHPQSFEFFDTPRVPRDFLAPGEYWQFQTLLVGVRDDGSWITWDNIGTDFSWKSNLTTSWEGGIFLKATTTNILPQDASGGIFDVHSDSPANQPPLVNPITGQNIEEGATVSLIVSGGDPNPGDIIAFSLDAAPLGATIKPSTGLFTWMPTDGPATAQVTVRVTDNGSPALSDTKTFTITVNNVPPTATITGPGDGVRGQPRAFTLSASDPSPVDQAAGFTFDIDWGDGSTQTVAGPSGLQLDHVYTDTGSYSVQVTATDKDGGVSAVASKLLTIQAAEIQGDTLAVGGTLGGDTIVFSPVGNSGGIDVSINGVSQGTFTPTGRIVAYGQAGDDDIQVAGSISLPTWLYGGVGNDRLKGGGGPSVLVGGDGDDLLIGGKGSNILIGGAGADRLVGGAGDDLLIAGSTAFDVNQAALDGLLAEWSSGRDYAARVANLTGTGNGARLNGTYFLVADQTVFDDGVKDQLTGSSGLDAFFANFQGPGTLDKITDLGKLELAMDV